MKDSLISLLEYYLEKLRSDDISYGTQQLLWDRLTNIPSIEEKHDLITNYIIGQYIRTLCDKGS